MVTAAATTVPLTGVRSNGISIDVSNIFIAAFFVDILDLV
jgi:hypothetical protein